MQAKGRRRIIDLSKIQPVLDFDEASHVAEFTLPEYQRNILITRTYAFLIDISIVSTAYLIFLLATAYEMSVAISLDRTTLGIYGSIYFLFLGVYFFLFMLSMSQTNGMRWFKLIAVNRHGQPLRPQEAFMRSFGYLISIIPLLFGFLWAFMEPEHLTWTDKVSGTFVKRIN